LSARFRLRSGGLRPRLYDVARRRAIFCTPPVNQAHQETQPLGNQSVPRGSINPGRCFSLAAKIKEKTRMADLRIRAAEMGPACREGSRWQCSPMVRERAKQDSY
jgi:hypothetical protein